jgi:hypothetical protein
MYTFENEGKYNVLLIVRKASWVEDTDNKIIYINSRAPEANDSNTIFLDWINSFDNYKDNNEYTSVLLDIKIKEKNDLILIHVKRIKYLALLSWIILLLLFGYYKIFRKKKILENVPIPAKLTWEIEIQEKTRKPSVKKTKTKLTKPSSKQKKTTKKKSTSVNKDVKKSGKSK